MPCPFTGPKMFSAGPNFLSQHKNLTAFSASYKPFVPAQKPIILNANCLAQKIWTSPKHFGTCKRTRQKSWDWDLIFGDFLTRRRASVVRV